MDERKRTGTEMEIETDYLCCFVTVTDEGGYDRLPSNVTK